MNRGLAASWSIGLGLLAGSIAGTIVPAETAAQEVRQVAGFVLVFTPALYAFVTRQWEFWRRTNPYVRFVVFQLSFFVAVVFLVRLVVLAFGYGGVLTGGAAFLAALVAFGVASWLTFYGGADRVFDALVERTDAEW